MERENIARAAKGDANAFEALMGAYETKIYALCLRMMGNPHDGEDAAQEAMLRIWRTIGQYRFESAFSTWIYRVTASCLYGRDPQASAACTAVFGGNGRDGRL